MAGCRADLRRAKQRRRKRLWQAVKFGFVEPSSRRAVEPFARIAGRAATCGSPGTRIALDLAEPQVAASPAKLGSSRREFGRVEIQARRGCKVRTPLNTYGDCFFRARSTFCRIDGSSARPEAVDAATKKLRQAEPGRRFRIRYIAIQEEAAAR
jgi:hypothetical protein